MRAGTGMHCPFCGAGRRLWFAVAGNEKTPRKAAAFSKPNYRAYPFDCRAATRCQAQIPTNRTIFYNVLTTRMFPKELKARCIAAPAGRGVVERDPRKTRTAAGLRRVLKTQLSSVPI